MLISAEKISKNYGMKQLLDGVSVYLNEGDRIGIIGINGTGKSTLLKILAGVSHADSGTIALKPDLQISYLPQDPEMNENRTVIEQVLADMPSEYREVNEYEAKAMLNKLGISDFDAIIGSLSGGQRKRVALASALIHPADVLILDEPTNHLDSEMVSWLENRLNKFSGGIIMITHDLGVVAETCDRCAVVYAGEIVESGSLEDIFLHAQHPYTKGLFGSIPRLNQQSDRLSPIEGMLPDPTNLPEGCNFSPRCPHCMEICKTTPPCVVQDGTHQIACHLYSSPKGGADA